MRANRRASGRRPIGIAILGIDIGTSSSKGVLVDDEARIRTTASTAHPLTLPSPGVVEADADRVWRAFGDVVSTLTRRARRMGLHVRALAMSVSVDEFVFVDVDARPIGRVIMAADTRVSASFRAFTREIGAERLYAITGLPSYPAYALARVLWLRDRRPGQFARLSRVLDWASFIALRLGLPPTTDPSVAARTMAWDVAAGAWSGPLLQAAAISHDLFPAVVPSGTIIGGIPERNGAELGLPAGAVLVAGGMDQWLAAVGSGVVEPGQVMVGTGTWEAVVAPTIDFPAESDLLRTSGISVGPFVARHGYGELATQIGGGALVAWFRDVFAPARSVSDLMRSAPDRPTGLLVLPHAEGSFSPWTDPDARAAITGLGLDTDRRTLFRGVLEGITFELRENVSRIQSSGLRVNELRTSGGGSQSAIWLQLKADVLARPVMVVDDARDAAAFGAAMMAGSAIGLFGPLPETARRLTRTTRVIEPRAAYSGAYDEIFERYRAFYPALLALRGPRRRAR